jgi:hypothetical protein
MRPQKLAAVAVLLAVTVAASSAPGALVSQWKLDDGSGTTATDSVGSNDATFGAGVNAPTWVTPGFLGTGDLSFNGSQWATAPDSTSLRVSTGITLSAWVKRGRTGAVEIFLGKGDGGGPGSTTSYWLYLRPNNTVDFYLGQPGSPTGTDHNLTGTATITDTDTWHLITGTYNGSVQKLYLDGVLQASSSWSGTIVTNALPFSIGKLGSAGYYYSGQIDDVGLWNTGLNDGEAIALYNLATSATFGYDLGVANQLFTVYEAQAGTVYLGGYRWEYKTGLTGTLGLPMPDGLGNYLLKLDGGTGTGAGLMASVPEPASVSLLSVGVLGLLLAARGRRRR